MSDINKDAIKAALRALGDSNVEVSFIQSNDMQPKTSAREVLLPEIDDLAKTRSFADESAAKLKFHNEDISNFYRPSNLAQAEIFDTLENLRSQSLLAKKYAGVFENISSQKTFDDSIHAAVGKIYWEKMLDIPSPTESMLERWISNNAKDKFEKLIETSENQQEFSEAAIDFISALATRDQKPSESQKGSAENSGQQNKQQDQDSDKDEQEEVEPNKNQDGNKMPAEKSAGEVQTSKGKKYEGASEGGRLPNYKFDEDLEYKVYTRAYDEVVHATALASQAELGRLRTQLDAKIESLKTITNKLANRLQNLLMAQNKSWWEIDQDDGVLDAKRLSRLIASPDYQHIYKVYKQSDFKDTVVTILIDNSGSMRGRPIMSAVACADILARVLEQCGVKVEILGFTTVEWKGGRSRQLWMKEGALKNPGRLNDLRHIIYKPADSPWRRSRKNLALALKDGLLKENIDGEAINWAANRVLKRPEERKILMVISDGAPVDDSTISANPSNYLDNHLRKIITQIESSQKLELLAIGIGHDVGRYYKNAITIMDINDLGETMITKMEELFGKAA